MPYFKMIGREPICPTYKSEFISRIIRTANTLTKPTLKEGVGKGGLEMSLAKRGLRSIFSVWGKRLGCKSLYRSTRITLL